MRRTDPLIVGGGPAGAAAAIHLARAGARPLIVERQPEGRDALCGGFLSWRTLERLEGLGIARGALGGHEVGAVRLFLAGGSYEIPLPAPSMGVSRGRLDSLLLARALEEGASIHQAVARDYTDGVLRLDHGERMRGEGLFLATGKHDLRGLARTAATGDDPMLGLRLRLPVPERVRQALDGHIEMHVFDGGYLGIVLQEDGKANACLAAGKSCLARAGGPAALFRALEESYPAIGERLVHMPDAPEIDAVAHIPYGWRTRTTEPGVFRLGDQAGVIASLAGEGIGIALASADEAARFWLGGGALAAGEYQRSFARRLRGPLLAGGMMARLARRPGMSRVAVALLTHLKVAHLVARATRIG